MKIVRNLCCVLILVGATRGGAIAAGGNEPPCKLDTPPSDDEIVFELITRGECGAATRYLERLPEAKRRPQWYVRLSDSHQACLERDGDESHRAAALSALEAGLKRYPKSSRLLLEKGLHLARGEDIIGARRVFTQARALALKNINHDKSGTAADDDRTVVGELDVIERAFARH